LTLEKAIEILTDMLRFTKCPPGDDDYVAIHLGIEGLKRIQRMRQGDEFLYAPPLPGETKE